VHLVQVRTELSPLLPIRVSVSSGPALLGGSIRGPGTDNLTEAGAYRCFAG
jgi:hypothetical protein